MTKRYELLAEKNIDWFGVELFKIRALVSFGVVKKGDEGGYIEKEENLPQDGDGWVFNEGKVMRGGEMWGGDVINYSSDYLVMQNIGSEFGALTAARQADGSIKISRGCFRGTIEEFRASVIKKHGGTLHEKAYLGIANYIEFHFSELHPFKEKK